METERTVMEGDIVVYVLPDGPSRGQLRPAFVVKVWSPETVNLQVFTDGPNDDLPAVMWATSIRRQENLNEPYASGTWHF